MRCASWPPASDPERDKHLLPSGRQRHLASAGRGRASRRIEENWAVLEKARDAAWIGIARDANPNVGAALAGYTNEDVFARIQQLKSAVAGEDAAKEPRIAEFDLFSSGRSLIGENAPQARLHAATLDRSAWDPRGDPLLAGIEALVAAHPLRDVSCLYGFTRFEPSMLATDDLEDVGLAVDGAPLGRAPTWLPAVELFGEGIFLVFDSLALASWLSAPSCTERSIGSSSARATRSAPTTILGTRTRIGHFMALPAMAAS
jgi:hypothetical protein